MKAFQELWQAGFGVGHHTMPMVGHEADSVQQDASVLGSERKAVLHGLIRDARGAQQELALRTAPSDQVTLPGQDLSRHGHWGTSDGTWGWLPQPQQNGYCS